MTDDDKLQAMLQAEVDFEIWKTYFQLALEGTAGAARDVRAIVADADAIATAAAKKHAERHGAERRRPSDLPSALRRPPVSACASKPRSVA
jgi:hypothetical protein